MRRFHKVMEPFPEDGPRGFPGGSYDAWKTTDPAMEFGERPMPGEHDSSKWCPVCCFNGKYDSQTRRYTCANNHAPVTWGGAGERAMLRRDELERQQSEG